MTTFIGRYEVVDFIGGGGAGDVYRALDPIVQRYVAVKLLTANTPDQLERFKRERVLLAKLNHTHIVPVYDSGEHDGRPFLVMPYVPGGTLYDRLMQDRMSYNQIASLLAKLASALDSAHGQGIVHRDIKPANILFNEQGEPLIADFGLSKIFTSDSGPSPTIDQVIGTPHYMSPEQIRGEQILPQSDMYALGIILFELCNGRRPFDADDTIAIIYKHTHEPVPPMPQLPPQVAAVIATALSKNPSDRFATAGAMSAAFQQAIASVDTQSHRATPVLRPHASSPPTGTGPSVPNRRQRNYAIAGVFGVLLLGIIALFAFSGSGGSQDRLTLLETTLTQESVTQPTVNPAATDEFPVILSTSTVRPTLEPAITSGGEMTEVSVEFASRFVITREEATVFSGPSENNFEPIDIPVKRGDELALVAARDDRTWVLVSFSTGVQGWIDAAAGRVEGLAPQDIPIAETVPAPSIVFEEEEEIVEEEPNFSSNLVTSQEQEVELPSSPTPRPPTTTPIPIVPTPRLVNPFDADGDGVLHNPDQNLYDLCQDAVGFPHTCGCPEGQVPNSCSSGGGGSDSSGSSPSTGDGGSGGSGGYPPPYP